MMTDDMIRSYLMLHPETPIDMTEYLFPLRAVKQLLEAAVRIEREACAKVCATHAKVYAELPKTMTTDAAWAACVDLSGAIRERKEQ